MSFRERTTQCFFYKEYIIYKINVDNAVIMVVNSQQAAGRLIWTDCEVQTNASFHEQNGLNLKNFYHILLLSSNC